MNNTDRIARIKELAEERLEVIEEKNALTEELMQIKAKITAVGPSPQGKKILTDFQTRRAELVEEINELNADIAEINHETKTLQGVGKTWDTRSVITMVAAYIAAGDTRPADEMARHAMQELEIIINTIEESKQ